MLETPNFINLFFPEKPNVKIKDFDFLDINSSTRIHYLVEGDKGCGFDFYITEFVSASGDKKYKSYYDDPNLVVECMFYGHVYFDGLRHLYMGDEVTGNENYLYCANTIELLAIFGKLRELEQLHCNVDQLD